MSLLKELIEQDQHINAFPLMEALDEAVQELNERQGLVKTAVKGAKDLISKNPALAVGAAALALNTFGQYQKNKRNMIKLHGKTSYEKSLMDDIVKKITATGSWKLERVKFESGGKSWLITRKWKS